MKDFDQLIITIPKQEFWDEKKECFIYVKEQTLTLKHSLVSISKWEAKWHKPFLVKDEKTEEELRSYINCMVITQNIDNDCLNYLSKENLNEINNYIEDPMTATTFSEHKNGGQSGREILTSELIYFYMCNYRIPPEYAKWHLNRLLTLIQVCNIKNTPPKKMSKSDILRQNSLLNASRRKAMHTKG